MAAALYGQAVTIVSRSRFIVAPGMALANVPAEGCAVWRETEQFEAAYEWNDHSSFPLL